MVAAPRRPRTAARRSRGRSCFRRPRRRTTPAAAGAGTQTTNVQPSAAAATATATASPWQPPLPLPLLLLTRTAAARGAAPPTPTWGGRTRQRWTIRSRWRAGAAGVRPPQLGPAALSRAPAQPCRWRAGTGGACRPTPWTAAAAKGAQRAPGTPRPAAPPCSATRCGVGGGVEQGSGSGRQPQGTQGRSHTIQPQSDRQTQEKGDARTHGRTHRRRNSDQRWPGTCSESQPPGGEDGRLPIGSGGGACCPSSGGADAARRGSGAIAAPAGPDRLLEEEAEAEGAAAAAAAAAQEDKAKRWSPPGPLLHPLVASPLEQEPELPAGRRAALSHQAGRQAGCCVAAPRLASPEPSAQ